MIYIIRNPDGNIKNFAERADDLRLNPGETLELSPLTFLQYAERFVLSVAGKCGETIKAHVGDPAVVVEVSCPEQLTVDLDINGTTETLQLTQGRATLQLSTAVPGVFIIQPADRKIYAAAGEGLLSVVVTE
ncbi:hypothetical protein EG834_03765 [bacterium]|nr:hypothetical protein [bacterium]